LPTRLSKWERRSFKSSPMNLVPTISSVFSQTYKTSGNQAVHDLKIDDCLWEWFGVKSISEEICVPWRDNDTQREEDDEELFAFIVWWTRTRVRGSARGNCTLWFHVSCRATTVRFAGYPLSQFHVGVQCSQWMIERKKQWTQERVNIMDG